MLNERHFTACWQMYFPTDLLCFQFTTEIKPGKGISKFSMIQLSLLPSQILEGIDIFYVVHWEANHFLIHHFVSFIQFAFSSCCGNIGRLKRWHFKLPTSFAITIIIHRFSQFSDDFLFQRTICFPFALKIESQSTVSTEFSFVIGWKSL